jgi:NADH-quinone oxidoreductase subunit L
VYAAFLIGGSALAALPFVTAGFFSKDEILFAAYQGGYSGLLLSGLVGAFLTSLYTFRLIFIVFHGESQLKAHPGHGISHHLPLLVLMLLSTFVGALITPPLASVFPAVNESHDGKMLIELLSATIAISGIALSAFLFLGKRKLATQVVNTAIGKLLSKLWFNAWGFDWLYHHLFVMPYRMIAQLLQRDPLDRLVALTALIVAALNRLSVKMVTGNLRWYAASMSLGALVVLTLLLVY